MLENYRKEGLLGQKLKDLSEKLDAIDTVYEAFDLLSVPKENLNKDSLVKALALLTSIKTIFVYKSTFAQARETGLQYQMLDTQLQRLFLEVAICLGRICLELSQMIKRQSPVGQILSKDDERQFKTYKEHVDQLTTHIDNLRTFEGAYQPEIGGFIIATV